jgi:trehalose-phosphatase
MAEAQRPIAELPNALERESELAARLAGRLPAVFLDYDGTLTPIVDRPEDALISDRMRDAVRRVAARFPVGVVSGRDRRVVQQLMGVDDLIVAGSHGFDIWSPSGGAIQRQEGTEFKALLEEVRERLERELGPIQGALVEPKSNSVAAHYRLVPEAERHRVGEVVEAVLREHPDELKLTPGKMVYEIQPKIDWDKGKAVLHLLHALGLDGDDVVPIYLGDDITDEDGFKALAGRGIGVFVGRPDDPEVAGRTTWADYVLPSIEDVERFLDALGRWVPARPTAESQQSSESKHAGDGQ